MITLDPEQLRDLADLVADQVISRLSGADQHKPGLVDAATIAHRFGVTRSWCCDHANELGAIRIGAGAKPRLRFDPTAVDLYLSRLSEPVLVTPTAKPRTRRQDVNHTAGGAPLLKIKT